MIDFTTVELIEMSTHYVGNKLRDEGTKLSSSGVELSDLETKKIVLKYFLSPFQNREPHCFTHPSEIGLNAMYTFSQRIFETPAEFHLNSIDIAKLLYESSTHPKIIGGELNVCLFSNCWLDGVEMSAIGLFKSEIKEDFLKFISNSVSFSIQHERGVNINKLDKGCLIFNGHKENGYKIYIVDSNKSDTQYWNNLFLNVKPFADNYLATTNFLSLAKEFVTRQLSSEFNISKTDQIDMLNKSVDYFKTNETFDKKDFEEKIFDNPEMVESFRVFDETYNQKQNFGFDENFEISSKAVKKQVRVFKSVLKLDENFDIYIHGDKKLIEKGTEQDGRKYYKIYYHEEK